MKDRHKNRVAHNKVDLIGRKIGKLEVLYDTGKRKTRKPIWKCKCDCGNEVEVLSKYLLNGNTKSCGCITKGNAHNRRGFKLIGQSYIGYVQRQAARRGIPFEVTAEDLYNQFVSQKEKCALTGITLTFAVNYRDQRADQNASLDRIDNAKGYTLSNIQWVHKVINIMRNKLSIDEFKNWCSLVTSHSA